MREVIRYQCDYCKKTYANKNAIKLHENRCFYNPENKECGSCLNIDEKCSALMNKGKIVKNCDNYINKIEYIDNFMENRNI